MAWALLAISALALAGCPEPESCGTTSFALEPGERSGPTMRPGNNCLRCHREGGQASRDVFTVGGTIFESADAPLCEGTSGVTVRITDANGTMITLVSNEVGNFWSEAPLALPYTIEAERDGRVAKMPVHAESGGCANCHSWPDPVGGALGRIRAP